MAESTTDRTETDTQAFDLEDEVLDASSAAAMSHTASARCGGGGPALVPSSPAASESE